MHTFKNKKSLKYNISDLSQKGEIFEVSFGQLPTNKNNSKSEEKVVKPKEQEIFIEENVKLEPEDFDKEVLYEEETKKRNSFFYKYVGKYFLCCQ